MRTVVGVHVHEEIVRLIERATRAVILVSPFVRPWPELRQALGRAIVCA